MKETASPQAIWDAALGELQIQVSKPNFDTWLRKTRAARYENDEFCVCVPSAFVAEYLERNQRSLVEKVLAGIVGKNVKVSFIVADQTEAPGPRQTRQAHSLQGTLPLFNPRYTFDTFVPGRSNQFAYAAALTVAANPGQAYNPLYLYGGPGLGKTHLLQAIGHTAVANNLKVMYVSAEQYCNDMMSALREQHMPELHARYRSVDMLLVDDVQFFNGKQKIGENFFHTFDDLHNSGRQIVITSDRLPSAMPLIPERLRSRFEWGLVTEVKPPDFETRLAILQGKTKKDGIEISDDVLEYLAAQVQQNIRVLEGSLNRVIAYARLIRAMVTPQLAAQAIKDIAGSQPVTPLLTAGNIIETVARSFQVDASALVGKKRDKETTAARRVAMYMLRRYTNYSLTQVGQELGGRDAAAVTNSCKKVAADMEANPFLRRKILEIQQSLNVQ